MEKMIEDLDRVDLLWSLEQKKLEFILFNLEVKITALEKWSWILDAKSKSTNIQTNNLIYLINDFKEELIDIYEELKKLKKEIISFKNYEGIFRDLICKNTEYKFEKEDNKCDNFPKVDKLSKQFKEI